MGGFLNEKIEASFCIAQRRRLCCALVVIEEIRGLERMRIAVESVVSVLLYDFRRKVGHIANFRNTIVTPADQTEIHEEKQ